jgi:hypothetical protein
MMEENICLKNRLTEILKNNFHINLLEQAEYFQNRLIKEDERVGLIRDDIVQLDKILLKHAEENSHIGPEIHKRIRQLKSYMLNAQKQFDELKSDFDKYIECSNVTHST